MELEFATEHEAVMAAIALSGKERQEFASALGRSKSYFSDMTRKPRDWRGSERTVIAEMTGFNIVTTPTSTKLIKR